MKEKDHKLTTVAGAPVVDNQNVMTVRSTRTDDASGRMVSRKTRPF